MKNVNISLLEKVILPELPNNDLDIFISEMQMGGKVHKIMHIHEQVNHYDDMLILPDECTLDSTIFIKLLVAYSLIQFQKLEMEFGSAVIITGDDLLSRTFALLAKISGASKILHIGHQEFAIEYVENIEIDIHHPENTINLVREILPENIPTIFVENSGDSIIIDLLFNLFDKWNRVLFLNSQTPELNIDYYNHIHRTGIMMFNEIFNIESVFRLLQRHSSDFIIKAERLMKISPVEQLLNK